MDAFIVPGTKGTVEKIYFAAEVGLIYLAIETDTTIPIVNLIYPDTLQSTMLRVVEEMERANCLPELWIDQKDVVVLFKLKPVSQEFLTEFLPNMPSAIKVEQQVELITTAEAELQKEAIDAFLSYFKKNSCCYIAISEKVGDAFRELWRVQLDQYHEGLPTTQQG